MNFTNIRTYLHLLTTFFNLILPSPGLKLLSYIVTLWLFFVHSILSLYFATTILTILKHYLC